MRFTLDGVPFELTADLVRSRLSDHVPEPIHEYWVEIDGVRWPVKQVVSVATGVMDWQRFQSQSSRRWLAKLGFAIGSGSVAAEPFSLRRIALQPTAIARERPHVAPDVVLVGCVKSTLDHGAPAKDLSVSDYCCKMRAYAEGAYVPWFILSADHGS